jgi:DNA replication and repair protein RecF
MLLAERDCLTDVTGTAPVLLLDDVLSELDAESRRHLVAAVDSDGQTLISSADEGAVASLGDQATRLRVDAGRVTL